MYFKGQFEVISQEKKRTYLIKRVRAIKLQIKMFKSNYQI